MSMTWTAHTIHFLTQPELRSLFRVMTRKRDRALFLVAYRHGLRASEVGLLHVDDLNLAQQRLTIHRVKRSLSGIYPLRADEVTALKAYLRERKHPSPSLFLSQRGTPISRRQLDTLMKHYGEEAGIPASKRHFHVLKHSIATHLLDAGADLRFVQDWVGHASIKNTVIYAQLTDYGNDSCTIHTHSIPPTSWAEGCLLNPSVPHWCNPLQIQGEIHPLGAFTYLYFCKQLDRFL